MSKFFQLFRKKGTELTLEILSKVQDCEMRQSEFLGQLKKCKNDLNAYFRVKKELLQYQIISFKLNQKSQKIIYLTDKGRNIFNSIATIEAQL